MIQDKTITSKDKGAPEENEEDKYLDLFYIYELVNSVTELRFS